MLIIDAKELRIGNLVDWPLIGIKPIELAEEIDGVFAAAGIGVRLDIEWLKRFGFIDPAANGNAYRMNVNSQDELCWYALDGYLRYQTQGSGFTRQLRHIRYVHQLQNLWYFFTGEELTIKEKTA